MRIEDFGGSLEVRSAEELRQALQRRFGSGVNELWLTHQERFPNMSISINGSMASLHYFPEEGHPGFQSIGRAPEGAGETVIFFTNTPTEEIESPSDSVVSVEQADDAAQEFLISPSLPRSIKWLEL